MIIILGENHNNYFAAAKLHGERDPVKRHPAMYQCKPSLRELEMEL